jgi:hypothetical protein
MIPFRKVTLSGSAPDRIREQTEGLESGCLRDLAVKLAGDAALTVSVLTYADGRTELEVLRTGPPGETGETIDSRLLALQTGQVPVQRLPIAGPPDVQNAAALVRTILADRTPL